MIYLVNIIKINIIIKIIGKVIVGVVEMIDIIKDND
jgi:hypothetical protein